MDEIVINDFEKKDSDKLIKFLKEIDKYFPVPLSEKVNLEEYVVKTLNLGINIFAKYDDEIIAVVLGYGNDNKNKIGYLSTIVVKKDFQGKGIANCLIENFKQKCLINGMEKIRLFVHKDNVNAIKLYEKCGFETIEEKANYSFNITMEWRMM